MTATLRTDFFFLPLFLSPFSFSPFFTCYLFVRQRWGPPGLSHILVRFLACVLGQRTSVVPYKGQNLITSGEVLSALCLLIVSPASWFEKKFLKQKLTAGGKPLQWSPCRGRRCTSLTSSSAHTSPKLPLCQTRPYQVYQVYPAL